MSQSTRAIGHLRKIWKITSEAQTRRWSSTTSKEQGQKQAEPSAETNKQVTQAKKPPNRPKTMAELDQEMRSAMEGLAGDGGEAGLELEDGKAVSMKRGVRENMFRYI